MRTRVRAHRRSGGIHVRAHSRMLNRAGDDFLRPFVGWGEALDYVSSHGELWYKAPLDPHARKVSAKIIGSRVRKIRISPAGYYPRGREKPFDPFVADEGHLDRLRRPKADDWGKSGIMNRAGGLGWIGTPKKEAVEFFLKHSGYVGQAGATKAMQRKQRRENAVRLARAEEYAKEKGWRFDWEEEQEPDLSWLEEGDDPSEHETLTVLLRDEHGHVLGSLGNVDFLRHGHDRENREYGRLVEAELALEAMP